MCACMCVYVRRCVYVITLTGHLSYYHLFSHFLTEGFLASRHTLTLVRPTQSDKTVTLLLTEYRPTDLEDVIGFIDVCLKDVLVATPQPVGMVTRAMSKLQLRTSTEGTERERLLDLLETAGGEGPWTGTPQTTAARNSGGSKSSLEETEKLWLTHRQ